MYCRIFIFLFFFFNAALAQTGMHINNEARKIDIPFQFINNLIFIPIVINGVELNFLLDTGSEETILFGLDDSNQINFQNVEKIKFKGYGSYDFIDGLKSTKNTLSVNGYTDTNHTVYIILDQEYNLSSQAGIPVNGIMGSHFFDNYLVEINYDLSKIFVYNKNHKIYKKLNKKYVAADIFIENNKPYFNANITVNNQSYQTKLLLDSGSSETLWLFQNQQIKIPNKCFDDYLGRGFSGPIYGKRSRLEKLKIEQFEFNNPLVAFPDSLNHNRTNALEIDGSMGADILKRFNIRFDYPNQKIYFKKNSLYHQPFNFNMSGIELQHDGLQWVKEKTDINKSAINTIKFDLANNKTVNFEYKFTLKPVFKIANIRKKSPAEKCGLQKDDIIITINNQEVYNNTLQQINELLKSKDGKLIKITVARQGILLTFKFILETLI